MCVFLHVRSLPLGLYMNAIYSWSPSRPPPKKVTQQEIRVWIPDQGIFLLGTEINADVPLERAEVLAEFLYLSIRS